MKRILLLFSLVSLSFSAFTQDTLSSSNKQIVAVRTEVAPKIDGFVSDAVWLQANVATDFTQLEPNPMTPSKYKTEVRVLYDDQAIYFSFMCYDESGDVVLRQLSERDNIGNTDWVGIFFNNYQDGQNGEGFFVTAAGVQQDVKFSDYDDDESWNAVWDSEVQILDNGWSVEYRIPYAALRFPNAKEQTWNINFARSVRRDREESWWDDINPKIDGYFNQFGQITGIKDIKSPLRLFLYPYISGNAEHFPYDENDISNWSTGFNAGLDLKYGINDAFTLDMTLIPDFGTVRSDNQVLNLSPFEVEFDENRQFFTEGTELFNKGGLFYSRRIGARPTGFYDVEDKLEGDEIIVSNPGVTQLINSTKISGRTNNGLGIGFFNSVTNRMHATVKNTLGEEREIETEPFTNYNIMVLDQNLKNNSFVTLINTNVQRFNTADDANVVAAIFRVNDKTNTYATAGKFAYNSQTDTEGELSTGFHSFVEFEKISGNFQFSASNSIRSDEYDPNDLGILFRNNSINNYARISYQVFEPVGVFNRMNFNLRSNISHRYSDKAFQDFAVNFNAFGLFRNFLAAGMFARTEPIVTYDYFEPRVEGRYLEFPTNGFIGGFISTDYRKKLAVDVRVNYRKFNQEGRALRFIAFEPRVRVNDKLSFNWEFFIANHQNDIGYATLLNENEDSIILGRRLQKTTVNELFANYIFNNKMGISLRMRHYWSTAKYNNFFLLAQDGKLQASDYTGLNPDGTSAHNISFNAFNIDAIFNWQFAPGSFMTVVWKNSIFRDIVNTDERYLENIQNTFDADQTNNFSIKILYFLDYLQLTKGK